MAEKESIKSISRSAFSFFSGTLISRFTGMTRDVAMAFFLGSTPALAAFMISYRFANLVRRLLGESGMAFGFIPHFESIRLVSPKKGAYFFRDLIASMILFLFIFLIVSEGLLWLSLKFCSPSTAEILFLTMLMLPAVLFISLFGICMAFLQCERHFFLPAVAPVAFNLVWIATVIFARNYEPFQGVTYLSFGVVIAFLAQGLVFVPAVIRYFKEHLDLKEMVKVEIFSPEIRVLIKPFFLGILGIGAVQINSAIDALFARHASLEGPAYLWYAIRFEQLPLALFGIALSSALLPSLSRAIQQEDRAAYRDLLQTTASKAYTLLFPCTIALFVLGGPAINLVLGHGDFSREAARLTSESLWGYTVGLIPAVWVLIFSNAFYSRKNYAVPMRASLISVLINLILNFILVFIFHLGVYSVALATSLSAFINCFYLTKRIEDFQWNTLSVGKTTFVTLIAGVMTFAASRFFHDPYPRALSDQFLQITSLGMIYLITLVLFARLFKAEEMINLIRSLRS
jgi:putative peptidoglycan lipid II flippase